MRSGRLLFVEFKAPGKEARPDQALEHGKLRGAGMEVWTIDNVDDFKQRMEKWLRF